MDRFLYDRDFRHERVKKLKESIWLDFSIESGGNAPSSNAISSFFKSRNVAKKIQLPCLLRSTL